MNHSTVLRAARLLCAASLILSLFVSSSCARDESESQRDLAPEVQSAGNETASPALPSAREAKSPTATPSPVGTPAGQVTALLDQSGFIAADPLARWRQLAAQSYVHGPVLVDPVTQAVVVVQPDLSLPLAEGELSLSRTWRESPSSAQSSGFDFGMGPGSARCFEDAACDGEGRVLGFTQGETRLEVDWQDGFPSQIRMGALPILTWHWEDGLLQRMDSPSGFQRTYRWGSRRELSSTFDGVQTTRYTYDAQLRLQRIEEGDQSLSLEFDAEGRLALIQGAAGTASRLAWDIVEGQQRCVITDPVGAVTTYLWDPKSGLLTTKDALDNTTTTQRNALGQLVSVKAKDGTETRFEYTPSGQLLALLGPGSLEQRLLWEEAALTGVLENTRVVRIRYDDQGRLEGIIGSDDHKMSFTRDPLGRLVKLDLPGGRTRQFSWDEAGRLARTQDQDGTVEERSYDDKGRLARSTDGQGKATLFSYDSQGRLVRLTHPDQTIESWQWSLNGQLSSRTDRTGAETSFTYDTAGRLSQVKRGTDKPTVYEFDAQGRITKEKSPAGVRRMTYDPLGRLETLSREDGITESYRWDSMGRLLERKQGQQTVWEGRYDKNGLLVEESFLAHPSKTYRYDELHRLVATTEGQQETSISWNNRGGATWRDEAVGMTWELNPTGWDGALRVTEARSDAGARTTFAYNGWGALVKRSDEGGETIQWTYDEDRNPTVVESNRSGTTRLSFDPLQRLSTLEQRGGLARSFRYDAQGNLSELVLADGTWKYQHDDAHRLTSALNPAGGETRFTWDARGNLSTRTSPSGRTERFVTDETGRMKTRTLADGSLESFQWDSAGRLLAWTREGTLLRGLEYDASGRVTLDQGLDHKTTSSISPDGKTTTTQFERPSRTVTRTRDAAGRTMTLDISGLAAFSYRRNAAGQIESVLIAPGKRLLFQHDALGRKSQLSLPEGGKITYSYASSGLLQEISVTGPSGTPLSFRFESDEYGRVKQVQLGSHHLQYGYDGLDRLAWFESSDSGRIEYSYDQAGSLVQAGSATIARGKDQEALAIPDGARTYIPSGAIESATTSGGKRSFQYDLAHRIQSVTLEDGTKVAYSYDGNGNLLSRTVSRSDNSATTGDGGESTSFLTSDSDLLMQEAVGQEARFFVPGDAAGERLATGSGDTVSYFIQGPDGSTLALVDGAGQLQGLYVREPFGRLIASEGSMAEPFGFRGHFADPLTGYLHFPMRWADPSSYSFLAPDPDAGFLARPETQNRYSFLANDPVNLIDPLGANPYEWDSTKTTLEGVCNLFQKGQVQAGHAFGKALDGFDYVGAIDKRGWTYDVWVKKIPGTDRVVTIIRDLNEKAEGPYGKPNLTGNIVIRETPTVAQPAAQTVSQTAGQGASQQGPGFLQRVGDSVRNTVDNVKHGAQLYGKEISTTVAGLGGVSGTLGTSVGTIAALPGGMAIIGIGVAVAGAIGYGTGTLIDMIPGVSQATQSGLSSLFGYEQNQTLANLKTEMENQGPRAREIQEQKIKENMERFRASGMPMTDGDPGVKGATVDIGGPTPNLGTPQDPTGSTPQTGTTTEPTGKPSAPEAGTAGEPGTTSSATPGTAEKPGDPSGTSADKPPETPASQTPTETAPPSTPDRKRDRPPSTSEDSDESPDGQKPGAASEAGEEDEGEDDEGQEGDDEGEEEEEAEEPEDAPPPTKEKLLEEVTPQQVSFTFQTEEDASYMEYKNTVTCKYVVTFWNVGALVSGYGGATMKGVCTASLNGVSANMDGSGTFSGGPNGSIRLEGERSFSIQINGGQSATIPQVGTKPLSNPGAFSTWPEGL